MILLAAVVLPLCDPVRLAEEMSVLDIVSRGRVAYVFGVGHRREEYEQFGVDYNRRGALADEKLSLLRELLAGKRADHDGRAIIVTPSPVSDGGPRLLIGGGSIAAAERAGRFGLGLLAQANPPGMQVAYEAACRANGHEPVSIQVREPGAPTAVFVAEDVDAAWAEIGPHLLHDAMTAASYRDGEVGVASISPARTVDELRADGRAYRVLTLDEAAARVRAGGRLPLAPLCGGLPPNLAWPYLERAAEAVSRSRS